MPTKTPKAISMKAIILCDDLAFTVSAASTLARVGRQVGVNVQWAKIFWPINALNEPALAKQALTEALDAQLILFPARCAQSLPRWVFDWLNRWAMLRTNLDAGIGILNTQHTAEPGHSSGAEISQFARIHGLALLADDQAKLARPVKTLDCWQPDSETGFSQRMTGSRRFASQPSYRAFGINE